MGAAQQALEATGGTGGGGGVGGGVTSAALDVAFGSTQGQILTRNATVWTVLNPGTAGYLLQTNGAGADASWVAAPSGGGVVVASGWNAADTSPNGGTLTLTNGGLTVDNYTSGSYGVIRGSHKTSGKRYVEIHIDDVGSSSVLGLTVGFSSTGSTLNDDWSNSSNHNATWNPGGTRYSEGQTNTDNSSYGSAAWSGSTGDVLCLQIDIGTGWKVKVNGGSWVDCAGAPFTYADVCFFAALGDGNFGVAGTHFKLSAHTTAATQVYAAPTGYSAWDDVASVVSSVALALPVSIFSITGSPVIGAGTLTGSFTTQLANRVFAGPVSGAASTPTMRALVIADLAFAGSANGVATLDGTGKVTTAQLPPLVSLSAANVFTARQLTAPTTLVQTLATISTDASLSNNYEVVLTQNATFAAPTNLVAGDVINLAIQQPASGGTFSITFASIWDFGGATAPVASTVNGKVDFLSGYYHSPTNRILASYRKGT